MDNEESILEVSSQICLKKSMQALFPNVSSPLSNSFEFIQKPVEMVYSVEHPVYTVPGKADFTSIYTQTTWSGQVQQETSWNLFLTSKYVTKQSKPRTQYNILRN